MWIGSHVADAIAAGSRRGGVDDIFCKLEIDLGRNLNGRNLEDTKKLKMRNNAREDKI